MAEGADRTETRAPEIERVFVEHYDAVYRFVLRLVRDGAEATDLTQETFTRAYESLPGFRGEATLKTWLTRIAQNIVLDRFRQISRRRDGSLDDDDVQAMAFAGALDQAQAAEQQQSKACVQRCVDALPDNYRQAVALHDMVGMTNAEIAKMLGVSLATVKIRVHRGRRRLRELAGRHCEVYLNDRNVMACNLKPGDCRTKAVRGADE